MSINIESALIHRTLEAVLSEKGDVYEKIKEIRNNCALINTNLDEETRSNDIKRGAVCLMLFHKTIDMHA